MSRSAGVAEPAGLRGRGHAGGVPADDDEPVPGHDRQGVIGRAGRRPVPRRSSTARVAAASWVRACADRPPPGRPVDGERGPAVAVLARRGAPAGSRSSCSTRQRWAGLPASCRTWSPSASATNDPHRPAARSGPDASPATAARSATDARRNTLPGLSRPAGSSASLIARCTSSDDRADLALQPVDLDRRRRRARR